MWSSGLVDKSHRGVINYRHSPQLSLVKGAALHSSSQNEYYWQRKKYCLHLNWQQDSGFEPKCLVSLAFWESKRKTTNRVLISVLTLWPLSPTQRPRLLWWSWRRRSLAGRGGYHSPGGRSGSLGAACWGRRGLATALELSETLRLVELEPLSWSSWGWNTQDVK